MEWGAIDGRECCINFWYLMVFTVDYALIMGINASLAFKIISASRQLYLQEYAMYLYIMSGIYWSGNVFSAFYALINSENRRIKTRT